jgi:hypothetical protein
MQYFPTLQSHQILVTCYRKPNGEVNAFNNHSLLLLPNSQNTKDETISTEFAMWLASKMQQEEWIEEA